MNHPIQCQCGSLQGQLSNPHRAIRGICYCKDCRAYFKHLDVERRVLDTHGGVEFVATQGKDIRFTDGVHNLACLSLTDKGLLRWYAACCNTPICNTTRDWKFSYVGLIHTCLKVDPALFEQAFPKLEMRVNTSSALAAPPTLGLSTMGALMRFMPRLVISLANGAYKKTPFFTAPAGAPVVDIHVISTAEREHAYQRA